MARIPRPRRRWRGLRMAANLRASAPSCSEVPGRSANAPRVLLAREGADVTITGRKREVVQAACDSIQGAIRHRVARHRSAHQRRARRRDRGRAHRARHGRRRDHVARREAVAGQQHVAAGGRRKRIATGGHRRRRAKRSRLVQARQGPVRPARLRCAQTCPAPRLHRRACSSRTICCSMPRKFMPSPKRWSVESAPIEQI